MKYQRGFSSIDNSDDGLEIKNRVLAVVAGYGFRVGTDRRATRRSRYTDNLLARAAGGAF